MGLKRVHGYFETMLSRVRVVIFPWLSGLNPVALQGTKVLEDREIRRSLSWASEGVPPQYLSLGVVKYTGSLATPKWEDVEQGRVFSFSCYLVKSAQSQKTSSKRCATSRPTSPPLRVRQAL